MVVLLGLGSLNLIFIEFEDPKTPSSIEFGDFSKPSFILSLKISKISTSIDLLKFALLLSFVISKILILSKETNIWLFMQASRKCLVRLRFGLFWFATYTLTSIIQLFDINASNSVFVLSTFNVYLFQFILKQTLNIISSWVWERMLES